MVPSVGRWAWQPSTMNEVYQDLEELTTILETSFKVLTANLIFDIKQQTTQFRNQKKALSLEPDKNKRCNLAICLLHMNRIPEAKSLLQAVSDSCGHKQMDDSYAKSFERAVEMLTELESKSVLTPIGEDKLKEVVTSTEGGRGDVSGSMDSRRWADGQNKEPVLSDKHIRGSDCGSHSENQGNFACSLSSQQNGVDNYWRKGLCFENPGERSTFSSKIKKIGLVPPEKD
ncbi:hypothetical protein GH714_018746 [Hevea brasiliensis]|uniref:Uncharacterized protein n=1 Tax=Hevea brasiliensis TaxID=3981 RepID=A0A6A6NCA6_HEVBR|nr:hypothetical protein GH714_018746 [Hevea brasiliensis]